MEEVFKDVVGYENGYLISSKGRVFSKHRNIMRKTHLNNRGYELCSCYKNRKTRFVLVHRMVALAFIPQPKGKNVINHIDCNTKNNSVENLEWCDMSHNILYAIKMGRFKPKGSLPGEKCGLSRLKRDEVLKIRKLEKEGTTQVEIAKMFNVWQTTISRIVRRDTWKHI